MYLNIFFSIHFFNQTFINTVIYIIKSMIILYHCFKLIIYRKFNSLNCKFMFYKNWILIFSFLNINMYWQHYYCQLHTSLYHIIQNLWFLKIYLNHLFFNLFPLQLLYNHKSALINMHYNKNSDKQLIL